MLVLSLETSTPQSSVCLVGDEGLVASAALGRGQAHGEFCAPAISFCLDWAGAEVADLTGVAVGVGPGLYTGMRVGIATAQALAHSGGLPVVGISSLDVLAFGARHARTVVCSVLDARRGEVFWAFYRSAAGGTQRISDMRVGPPERLADAVDACREAVVAIGDGAGVNTRVLEAAGAEVVADRTNMRPDAQNLAALAVPRFRDGATQRPEDLRPTYLRRPDARINWEHRGALHGGVAPTPTGA